MRCIQKEIELEMDGNLQMTIKLQSNSAQSFDMCIVRYSVLLVTGSALSQVWIIPLLSIVCWCIISHNLLTVSLKENEDFANCRPVSAD